MNPTKYTYQQHNKLENLLEAFEIFFEFDDTFDNIEFSITHKQNQKVHTDMDWTWWGEVPIRFKETREEVEVSFNGFNDKITTKTIFNHEIEVVLPGINIKRNPAPFPLNSEIVAIKLQDQADQFVKDNPQYFIP